MQNIIAGIDSGYGFAIGKSNTDKEITMRNYIRRITEKESQEISDNITEINSQNILIKYNNNYYICGDLCLSYYPQEQMKIDDNRVNNIFHLLEILMIVGQLSKENEFNLYLTVGLPNRLKQQTKSFINWLTNIYEFSFLSKNGEIKKTINIKEVSCIPQVYSPIFTLPNDKRNKYICSIDLGHKTTDIMLINRFNIVQQAGTIIDAQGCIYLYKQLNQLLLDKYSNTLFKKKEYSQILLQNIFEKEEYYIGEERQDIQSILDYVQEEYLDYIYYKVENNLSEYLVDVDIFIASGGILRNDKFRKTLANKFKQSHGKPFMCDKDPQLAIVNGLFNYALLKYKDDTNTNNNIDNNPIIKEEKNTRDEVASTDE
jgi:plasmid segregation protein ParM